MSRSQTGFFLVPAEHLAELYDLREHASRVGAENHHDYLYRYLYHSHRVGFRAQELAVASVLIPKPDVGDPDLHTYRWLRERFATDQHQRSIYDPDEVAAIKAHMERHGFQDLAAYARANARTTGRVTQDALRPYYDALEEVLRSAQPGIHGLVVGSINEEYREPPPPPPPLPPLPPETDEEPTEAAEKKPPGKGSMGAYLERLIRNQRRRYTYTDWYNFTSEGRVLLGCLPAEDGPGWLDMVRDAGDEPDAAARYEALRRFSDAIEPALEHGLVDSSAGLVFAIETIRNEIGWREREDNEPVLTPDEVRALRQGLDRALAKHGGEDKFVRWLKKQARHWKIAIPRAALAAVREHLDRAIATDSWLLWLHDIYDWPGEI